MSGALAIFVKTPGRSALKTRLAAVTGEDYAQRWYALAADAVASVAVRAREAHGITPHWAVAEAGAEADWSGLSTIAQGEGDLGTRMARVHGQLVARHGFAILLGADTPQLTVEALGTAARWLAGRDEAMAPHGQPDALPKCVLGPATDGGFWLFGSNRAVALNAWTRVHYSQSDTADRFRQSMGPGRWKNLQPLTDVDRFDDLKPAQRALDALVDPTIAQRTLAQWMRESPPLPANIGR